MQLASAFVRLLMFWRDINTNNSTVALALDFQKANRSDLKFFNRYC